MKKHLHKMLSAAIVAVAMFSAGLRAQMDSALAAELQQILDHRVQVSGDHGVSACVIMPNGRTWKGTAGVGKDSLAITDSTVFHGASITKANIATLILLLAEDGLLSLDSSWTKYTTGLDVDFDTAITVRQLISNTSGIADYLETSGTPARVTIDFNRVFTPEEILEDIVYGVPRFPAGTDFGYSTSNFVLAALIAQNVTGHPVQEELHARIWDPLGMTHTYFGGFETYSEPRAGVWWNFGSGLHNYTNDPETSMLTYGFGGANIVSTPEDLARFARALFGGRILSQASMDQMRVFSPQSYSDWCAGYGLGIHNASSFGTNSVLGHDGYYTNMADMFHSFDYGFTLVTMTNTNTDWFAIFDEMYPVIRDYVVAHTAESHGPPAISIFPNPTSDNLTVFLGSAGKEVEVTVTDIAGKTLYENTLPEMQRLEINTRFYAEGVYTLRIHTAFFTVRKKFIVIK